MRSLTYHHQCCLRTLYSCPPIINFYPSTLTMYCPSLHQLKQRPQLCLPSCPKFPGQVDKFQHARPRRHGRTARVRRRRAKIARWQEQRKVGMCAVLSDDPALYSHFKAPGAFGGATITDPWNALTKYKALLEGPDHNCDMVLPLQHLYVNDDERTCREFDFPCHPFRTRPPQGQGSY